MTNLQQTIDTYAAAHNLILHGQVVEAAAMLFTAAQAAQAELEQYEEWLEGQAEAEAAWQAHGDQLCKDLNSYPADLEECPF